MSKNYRHAQEICQKYLNLSSSMELNSSSIVHFIGELKEKAGFANNDLVNLSNIRKDFNSRGVERVINEFYYSEVRPFL
jgi:DNA-binding ferritin-like protein (Dps family)